MLGGVKPTSNGFSSKLQIIKAGAPLYQLCWKVIPSYELQLRLDVRKNNIWKILKPSQKKFPTNLVLGACLTQNLLLFQTRQPFSATQANQASFAGAINHHETPWSPIQRGT